MRRRVPAVSASTRSRVLEKQVRRRRCCCCLMGQIVFNNVERSPIGHSCDRDFADIAHAARVNTILNAWSLFASAIV